jgi:hypothetical protein
LADEEKYTLFLNTALLSSLLESLISVAAKTQGIKGNA